MASETEWTSMLVKRRLDQYREAYRDMCESDERLQQLRDQAAGLGASIPTGMPRNPSPPTDRMGALVAQIVELEEVISEDIEALTAERHALEGAIRQLRRAEQKGLLRLRYIDCLTWEAVASVMFGGKADFLGKEESYQRRLFRSHQAALEGMAEILNRIPRNTGEG